MPPVWLCCLSEFNGARGADELSAGDFLALAASEILGAFVGAVLVWIHFLPHFKTVPEPPSGDPVADLMRTRDYIERNARQFASYNTQALKVGHCLSVCLSLHSRMHHSGVGGGVGGRMAGPVLSVHCFPQGTWGVVCLSALVSAMRVGLETSGAPGNTLLAVERRRDSCRATAWCSRPLIAGGTRLWPPDHPRHPRPALLRVFRHRSCQA
jgi:hypothetical protein